MPGGSCFPGVKLSAKGSRFHGAQRHPGWGEAELDNMHVGWACGHMCMECVAAEGMKGGVCSRCAKGWVCKKHARIEDLCKGHGLCQQKGT